MFATIFSVRAATVVPQSVTPITNMGTELSKVNFNALNAGLNAPITANAFIDMMGIPRPEALLNWFNTIKMQGQTASSITSGTSASTTYAGLRLSDGSLLYQTRQNLTNSIITNSWFYPAIMGVNNTVNYNGYIYGPNMLHNRIGELSTLRGMQSNIISYLNNILSQNNISDPAVAARYQDIDLTTGLLPSFFSLFPNSALPNITQIPVIANDQTIFAPSIWFGQLNNNTSSAKEVILISYMRPYLEWSGKSSYLIYYDLSKNMIIVQANILAINTSNQTTTYADFWGSRTMSSNIGASSYYFTYSLNLSNNTVTYFISDDVSSTLIMGTDTANVSLTEQESGYFSNSFMTTAAQLYPTAPSVFTPEVKSSHVIISSALYNVERDALKKQTPTSIGNATQFTNQYKIFTISDMLYMKHYYEKKLGESNSLNVTNNNINYSIGKTGDGSYISRASWMENDKTCSSLTAYPTVLNSETDPVTGIITTTQYDGYYTSSIVNGAKELPDNIMDDLSKFTALPANKMTELQSILESYNTNRAPFFDLSAIENSLTGAQRTSFDTFKSNNFLNGSYTLINNPTYTSKKITATKVWFGTIKMPDGTFKRLGLIVYNVGYLSWTGENQTMILYDFEDQTVMVQVAITCFAGSMIIPNDGALIWGDNFYSTETQNHLIKVTYFLEMDEASNNFSYRFGGQGIALPECELTANPSTTIAMPDLGPLTANTTSLAANCLSPLFLLPLTLNNVMENYKFYSYWNDTQKQYSPITDNEFWRFNATSLKYEKVPALSNLLLYGITTLSGALDALGLFGYDAVKTLINNYIGTLVFEDCILQLPCRIAYLNDKFCSVAYENYSNVLNNEVPNGLGVLAPGTVQNPSIKIVFAGMVKFPFDKYLSNDILNPLEFLDPNVKSQHGLVQCVIRDDKGYHIQKYYTLIKNNIAQPINQFGCGVTATYTHEGDIIYSLFVPEPALISDRNNHFVITEYQYKINTSNVLTIKRLYPGQVPILLRTAQLTN